MLPNRIADEPDRSMEPSPWFVQDAADAERQAKQPDLPRAWWRRAWQAVAETVNRRDVIICAGLLLLGRGCYLYAPALGWGVPGALLLWWALPQRPRFLEPKPPKVMIAPPDSRWPGVPNGPVR